MKGKLTKKNIIGIVVGVILIILDVFFLRQNKIFFFILGLGALIITLPFVLSSVVEAGREKEKEGKFLEFSRDLVQGIKSGTPISKSILNLVNKDYGALTKHIKKLGNQIKIGIPVRQAFQVFAKDAHNKIISRSVELMTEAEQSGGNIGIILESVAQSVTETENLKKERKSAMFNMIVQGYIIFFIFIIIMLVVQYKFIPLMLETLSGLSGQMSLFGATSGGASSQEISINFLNNIFLILLVVQGFFTGLVIGKLSQGKVKRGIPHSAILIALAYLIITGVKAFL